MSAPIDAEPGLCFGLVCFCLLRLRIWGLSFSGDGARPDYNMGPFI